MKNNGIIKLLLALALGLSGALANAAESTPEAGEQGQDAVSYAMQKTMDPNVWTKLMGSMMSGELQGQPMIASCVECHTSEDIARYQKDYGGMMHAMNPMMQAANPQFYGGAGGAMMPPMTGMMNPMTGMMAPMTGMMNPMTGMMMAPMGMMSPMMMAPMGMMNPMMMAPMTGMMMPGMGMPGMGMPGMGMPGMGMPGMGMPGMGMPGVPGAGMPPIGAPAMPGMPPMGMMPQMAPAMPGMPPMGMMPQMPGMGGTAPGAMQGQPRIMDPKQYEKFYQQWTDMMPKMAQPKPEAAEPQ